MSMVEPAIAYIGHTLQLIAIEEWGATLYHTTGGDDKLWIQFAHPIKTDKKRIFAMLNVKSIGSAGTLDVVLAIGGRG